MKRPRFTDEHKFAAPYRPACKTNIRATFKRVKQQQAKQEERKTS